MHVRRRFRIDDRAPVRGATSRARAGEAALVLLVAAAAGCAQPRTICGDPSPRGGPPVIASKDAELCESVRLRVAEALAALPDLYPERAEMLRDRTWSWEDASSVDGMLRRVRADAGEELAAAVARAVEDVRTHSTFKVRAECADAERCLVRGAALGARIAFDDAAQVLRAFRRAASPFGAELEPER